MDRARLTIFLAMVGVIGVGAVALAASLVVPYNVSFGAQVISAQGTGTYARGDAPPAPLPEGKSLTLPVGSTIQLEPQGQATLTLHLNNGRVELTGPTTWTLVDSYRRATSLGHMLQSERFAREYVLVFAQTQGTAYYDFSATSPPFEDLSVAVELPHTRYIPTRPCWEIVFQADGSAQATDVPCR